MLVWPQQISNSNPKVHGDGFCWAYAFLVAFGLLDSSDFPHGDAGSKAPSRKATNLALALATVAFSSDNWNPPRFSSSGEPEQGTWGGVGTLLAAYIRLRPLGRLIFLGPEKKYIRTMYTPKTRQQVDPKQRLKDGWSANGSVGIYDCRCDLRSDDKIQLVTTGQPVSGRSENLRNDDAVMYWAPEDVHWNALAFQRDANRSFDTNLQVLVDAVGATKPVNREGLRCYLKDKLRDKL